jgi:hypothetical protein
MDKAWLYYLQIHNNKIIIINHCARAYIAGLIICKYILESCGLGYLSRYSDWLGAGRFGDQIPMGGEIFRTPSIPALEPSPQPSMQWVSGINRG